MGSTDYQALLNDLRTKFREEKRQEFTRENILYLLDSLFEHLSSALASLTRPFYFEGRSGCVHVRSTGVGMRATEV